MIDYLAMGVLVTHYCLLFLLCMFGLHRVSMVLRWYKTKDVPPTPVARHSQLPMVTVQIPIFNERFVAERAIRSAVALDYPTDKLEIQVVDDSTDDTYHIIAKQVNLLRRQGVNITHNHRVDRAGFKAGALKEAMAQCSGEYVAIFDADFIPDPDFLLKTIHCFSDEKVAMVQTRWEHLNRDSNLLTDTQAVMLDAHFALEQHVRCVSGQLFNFNGTAGIWRKQAIVDAGNWSADTLTEDLDLSYRAQMAGWKMHYLNDVTCPAELPSNLSAFKSQQHRWAKGGTQVMLKMLSRVWASDLRFSVKLESTFHLANNLAYLVMLTDTLLFLIPSLIAREYLGHNTLFPGDIPLILLSSGGHLLYLYFGQIALGISKRYAICKTPSLVLLGIHLALNNARAGLEALLGKQSGFVRTPKNGEKSVNGKIAKPKSKVSYQTVLPKENRIEILIAFTYVLAAVWALQNENFFMLPFLVLLIIGFSGVVFGRWRGLFENQADAA